MGKRARRKRTQGKASQLQAHLSGSALPGALPRCQPPQADNRGPWLSPAAAPVRLRLQKKQLQLHISHKNNNDQRERKAWNGFIFPI